MKHVCTEVHACYHVKKIATLQSFASAGALLVDTRSRSFGARYQRRVSRKKVFAYRQKSRGETLRRPGLGPITPLSRVYRGVSWIPIDSGVLHRRYPIMAALRGGQETVCIETAPGIWITILYGVYLYGEKCCSGITVRSLRSPVPAARKSHLSAEGIGEAAPRAPEGMLRIGQRSPRYR